MVCFAFRRLVSQERGSYIMKPKEGLSKEDFVEIIARCVCV